MTNFDTHRVRNRRTGETLTCSSWHASDLVATGEWQHVQVIMAHRNPSGVGAVAPTPDHYIEHAPCIKCDHWSETRAWYAAKQREAEIAAKGYKTGYPRDWLDYRT